MPAYTVNYQGSRIVLSHNNRERNYTLTISKGENKRTLTFIAQDTRKSTNVIASDINYFKSKSPAIRSAIRQFPHREKMAVLSALENL